MPGRRLGVTHPNAWLDFVQFLVSDGLCWPVVPLFFLISGYLFFSGSRLTTAGYVAKLRSRVRSLLVPFLFWNILVLALFALAQTLPAARTMVSGKAPTIAEFGAYDYARAILGIRHRPIAYQFWYVRDLMLLVLLAPLIGAMARRVPYALLVPVCVCWVLHAWPVYAPSPEATLLFAIGAYLAVGRRDAFALDRYAPVLIGLYACAVAFGLAHAVPAAEPYVPNLIVALGVPAWLCVSGIVVRYERVRERLLALRGSAFFVFAAHEPLLTFLRKVFYVALRPVSPAEAIGVYLVVPILTASLLVVVYQLLAKTMPGPLRVISGGR